MKLTDFLAVVGRDFALQQRLWHAEDPQLVKDQRFRQMLGHHGFDRLDAKHQGLLERGDLAGIQQALAEEADVTAHQVGFGPCWVLVRV